MMTILKAFTNKLFEKSYKIIAKGMRDTQGGIYNKKDKVVLMTEHGPTGGDEINSKPDQFEDYANFDGHIFMVR